VHLDQGYHQEQN